MTIRFRCGECNTRIKVPDSCAGLKVKCPSCSAKQFAPDDTELDRLAAATGAGSADMTGVITEIQQELQAEQNSNLSATNLAALAAAATGEFEAINESDEAKKPKAESKEKMKGGHKVANLPTPKPQVVKKKKSSTGSTSKTGSSKRAARAATAKKATSAQPLDASWPKEKPSNFDEPAKRAEPAVAVETAPSQALPYTGLKIATVLLRLLALAALAGAVFQVVRLRAYEVGVEDLVIEGVRGFGTAIGVWAFAEICAAVRNMARR